MEAIEFASEMYHEVCLVEPSSVWEDMSLKLQTYFSYLDLVERTAIEYRTSDDGLIEYGTFNNVDTFITDGHRDVIGIEMYGVTSWMDNLDPVSFRQQLIIEDNLND